MYKVILVILLFIGDADKPIRYEEKMTSTDACASAVREMTYRAPNELKEGGEFHAACVIAVPKSENP